MCIRDRSQIVPGTLRGETEEETAAKIFVALQLGYELGLSPMAALQSIYVVNGIPTLYGDGMLAVVRQSGLFDEAAFKEEIIERDGTLVARCTVRRLPDGKPVTREYSLKQAQAAGLTAKQVWRQFPHRMLQMRARSWALRDAFSDVLKGLRATEELIDVTPADVPASVSVATEQNTIAAPTTTIDQLLGEKPAEEDKPKRKAKNSKRQASKAQENQPEGKTPAEEPSSHQTEDAESEAAKVDEFEHLIASAGSTAELEAIADKIKNARLSEVALEALREAYKQRMLELQESSL